ADDMSAHPPAMRRGEDFLGWDIGVAGDAVPGGGGAANPFVAIREPDRQIHAAPGIMQGMEALAVQPFGAAAQGGVMFLPCGDGTILIDARGGKDRIRKL